MFLMTSDYKKIINEYAENGYSYVGYIPKLIDAKGCLRKIDLILKKQIRHYLTVPKKGAVFSMPVLI